MENKKVKYVFWDLYSRDNKNIESCSFTFHNELKYHSSIANPIEQHHPKLFEIKNDIYVRTKLALELGILMPSSSYSLRCALEPKISDCLEFWANEGYTIVYNPKSDYNNDIFNNWIKKNKVEKYAKTLNSYMGIKNDDDESESSKSIKEFTFLKNNPMQRARALASLSKYIRDTNGVVRTFYEWIESFPKDLVVGESEIYSSKSDKGYVSKKVIGDHIVESKAEVDYYNYLVEGGYPYSKYLSDEAVIKLESDKIKKIEKEKSDELNRQIEKENYKKSIQKKYQIIKSFIEEGIEPQTKKIQNSYKERIENLQKERQTKDVLEEIDFANRMIKQNEEKINDLYVIAINLYKIVNGEVVPKFDWNIGDEVKVEMRSGNYIPTTISDIRDNIDGSITYKVEKKEGIYNNFVGYDSLYPNTEIKKIEPNQVEPTKKEYTTVDITRLIRSLQTLADMGDNDAKTFIRSLKLLV